MNMNKKKLLVAASIAGLMTSSVAMAGAAFPGQDSMNKSHCDMHGCKGAGSCKGAKNACKSMGHACGGKNSCPGKETAAQVADGQLAGK